MVEAATRGHVTASSPSGRLGAMSNLRASGGRVNAPAGIDTRSSREIHTSVAPRPVAAYAEGLS
jgi:hypothetical protein